MSNIDNINSHFYRNIGNIISFIVDVSPSTNNNNSYRQQISEKIKVALFNRSNAILIEQISENLSVQMDLQIVEGNNIICQSILVTQGDKQYSIYKSATKEIVFVGPDGIQHTLFNIPEFRKDFFDKFIGFFKEMLKNDSTTIAANCFYHAITSMLGESYQKLESKQSELITAQNGSQLTSGNLSRELATFVSNCMQYESINNLNDEQLKAISQVASSIFGISIDLSDRENFYRINSDGAKEIYSLPSLLSINSDGSYRILSPYDRGNDYGATFAFNQNLELQYVNVIDSKSHHAPFMLCTNPPKLILEDNDYRAYISSENDGVFISINKKRSTEKIKLSREVNNGYTFYSNFSKEQLSTSFPALHKIIDTSPHIFKQNSFCVDQKELISDVGEEIVCAICFSPFIQNMMISFVSNHSQGISKQQAAIKLRELLAGTCFYQTGGLIDYYASIDVNNSKKNL